jgi:hypothetical protein
MGKPKITFSNPRNGRKFQLISTCTILENINVTKIFNPKMAAKNVHIAKVRTAMTPIPVDISD